MEHAYTALGALTLWAVLFVAGCCGLAMFKAMHPSLTASGLRREAVISMTRQASFCSLNSHQQAAVFAALYASEPPPERSTPQGRSRGFHPLKPSTERT